MPWEGYVVSVRCGALGCYQGIILTENGDSITLTKPFRNGYPYPTAQVTLKLSDIESLEIISRHMETGPVRYSTVEVRGNGRGARAFVSESLLESTVTPASPTPGSPASPPEPDVPTSASQSNFTSTKN